MTRLLDRLAIRATVPVYPVIGPGWRQRVQALRLREGIELVDSPRAANVLLLAGDVAPEHREALARVHDALPHPRRTVAWGGDGLGLPGTSAVIVASQDDPLPAVRAVFADLVLARQASEGSLLPDVDPSEWRGVGPYGQGGSGMTGGTPYGRPMAELAPDRDGLRLDAVPIEFGPFSSLLPPGLLLDVKVAGDITMGATVRAAMLPSVHWPRSSPFVRGLTEPVPIAAVEIARARSHLAWLAEALRLAGLPSLGLRALSLGLRAAPDDMPAVRQLATRVARSGVYRWSLPRALEPVPAGLAAGPVSRAAGHAEDARLEDDAYRRLGFEPILGDGGGAVARWRLRLAEIAQSLDLAARAGASLTTVTGAVESPHGRMTLEEAPAVRVVPLIPGLIEGLEWGAAIATIASLDLDLDGSSDAGVSTLDAGATTADAA